MGADKIRPEELINGCAKARRGVGNIVNAVGFLALLWSTVVLLGGFVSVLRIKDFWYLTVLSFVMASKVRRSWRVEQINKELDANYFDDLRLKFAYVGFTCKDGDFSGKGEWWHLPSREREILRGMRACNIRYGSGIVSTLVVAKCTSLFCVATIFTFAPYACIVISVTRLVQRDYGEAGGDAANKEKLEAALDIFYALVLIQSCFQLYWILLNASRSYITVSNRCGFGDWGYMLVLRYLEATHANCSKDEPLPTDWNLVTYAVGLLESASLDDRLSGARVLDTFIKQCIAVRQELLSSRKAIQNLIAMIQSTNTAHSSEIRERAARIVAHLASDILTTQLPGALQCACSLLESHKQYIDAEVVHPSENAEQSLDKKSSNVALENPEPRPNQEGVHLSLDIIKQTDHQQIELPRNEGPSLYLLMINRNKYFDLKYPYTFVSKGTKELISQGLLILERLTQDQDNCTAICNHARLLSKITSPIMSYQDFHINTYDQIWVEMITRSLTVLSRLIISPGEGASRLSQRISCNPVAVRNLMGILESGSESIRELREQAMEILTELAFNESFRNQTFDESSTNTNITEKFMQILGSILFEDEDGSAVVANQDRLKHKSLTRKAGEALARLLAVPSTVGATDALNSAANGYGNAVDPRPREDVSNMLKKVLHKILSCKTEAAADGVAEDVASNGSVVETAVESQPSSQDADSIKPSTQETEEQSEERKLIAAMLSLTVVICTKYVVTEDDFARAAPEDAALVKKLKEIIEINQDTKPDCLRIVKLSCQVVITISHLKPSCIKDFSEHRFKEVLSKALNTMSDLDNCMLFAGEDHEVTKPVVSLPSLVKKAQRALQLNT